MLIDCIASLRHFADHLQPVWDQLPEWSRGAFGATLRPGRGPVLVAAYVDLQVAQAAGRPAILLEHGAGQPYGQVHTSYAGGPGRQGVALLLVPGPTPAARNRLLHPDILVREVGCPKLDPWHRGRGPAPGAPVVAISWHWDCYVCPETRSAWPFYRDELAGLAEIGTVLGHGHPRILDQLRPVYEGLSIEVVEDFTEVLDRAHVYACDNSSTLFEFASCGRPVVLLNCPLYRRDVEHGLRFWSEADVGIQAEPGDLVEAVRLALQDPPEQQEARRRAVARVYSTVDGWAAYRAAQAVMEVYQVMAQQDAESPGPIRMQALKGYSGHEGKVRPGDTVFPGWRRTRSGGWEKVFGVNPTVRAGVLEKGRFAQRVLAPGQDAPETQVASPPEEDKRFRPEETAENKASPPSTVTVKCSLCGETFISLTELRKHRKQEHKE